jgi:signal transduction histidine kinase
VTIDLAGPSITIDGDAALLRRAFENIIRNALEANASRIQIETTPAPSRVTVTDNGAGVDDDDVPRLFLPFQSGKPSGFGLGLALTKKIVLLHGGWIRLTGKRGEGATVVIEFPPPAA